MGGRRSNNEGTAYRYRDEKGRPRYRAQWRVPDPASPDGPQLRKSKAGFTTKKDALDYAAEMRAASRRGRPSPAATTVTLGEHATAWLAGHRAAASTLADYRRKYRLHIEPNLGAVELGKIRPTLLAALYRQLETGDPAGEKQPLGANTVRKVHDLLSVMLQAAVDDGIIATNPAQHPGAKPPRAREVKAAKPDIVVWDAGTLAAFLRWAEVEDPDMHALWQVAAGTGMRRSELCGLEWGDISLKDGFLHVKRALTEVKTKGQPTAYVVGPTKNGRPRRIELDDDLVHLLRAHRTDTAQLSFANVAPDARVFTLASGRMLRPDRATRRFEQAVARFQRTRPSAPTITLHGLRHTHATLLLADGEQPKVVQERLGHETLAITMETCGHVLPGAHRAAAARFGRLLRG